MQVESKVEQLAQTMSILGDSTRLAIVVHLLEMNANVSDIAENMQLSQPLVSHHLRILKDARILKSQKKGKCVYYSIDDDHVKEIIEIGLKHMEHGE